ncbi:MAG: twin-arginine translocase TatA/TatE family subunit [Alphaproteobacteria bacterium]
MRLGWAEILVIILLVLVLFGHNKIPGMMKNLADGINIFKRELKSEKKTKNEKKIKNEKNIKKQKK